ncbi:MAG: capsule biosynthesis protein CapK [unclassified Hahellaceae]|nr:capsule biosynthesis protein CapK [Hahellaceae bacterium]
MFRQYDELKQSEWLGKEALHEVQLKNAAQFLRFAGKHSPYYRRLFAESSFDPKTFSDFDDLKVVPETSKGVLISENKAVHAQDFDELTRIAETSGTSGAALEFRRNERWDSLNRASVMRAYDWYGVKPWDRNGYLWGYNISSRQAVKVKLLDALQNRFRLFNYSVEEIGRFSHKLANASFLNGYSSMVYEIAKVINENNLERPALKMVKGTSEMILDIYHRESLQAFGRKVTSEYGAAESGLIAFECPQGNMHINVENLFLETNDQGEALVTNFASYSFPIIRYNLGDAVTLDNSLCECGRAHPLVKDISGRKGAKVIGTTGTYPALTFYYVFKNLALQNNLLMSYKAVQSEPGKVTLLIEDPANKKHEAAVQGELLRYFDGDIHFEIQYPDKFDATRKKRQYFESTLKS